VCVCVCVCVCVFACVCVYVGVCVFGEQTVEAKKESGARRPRYPVYPVSIHTST